MESHCSDVRQYFEVPSASFPGEGNGTLLQYSCLENPMDRKSHGQSMGSLQVRHDWATSLSLFTFMPWRRKWQPASVFLPGESQGWGSLAGCHLWGRTFSRTQLKRRSSSSSSSFFPRGRVIGLKSIYMFNFHRYYQIPAQRWDWPPFSPLMSIFCLPPVSPDTPHSDPALGAIDSLWWRSQIRDLWRRSFSFGTRGQAYSFKSFCISSIQFTCSVVSDSLKPHEPQHAKPPCPSPTPRAYLNSCPLHRWCRSTISCSVIPSPPALNLSQHQGLFEWVSSLHQVAKILEFQLQLQSFQWTPRHDLL